MQGSEGRAWWATTIVGSGEHYQGMQLSPGALSLPRIVSGRNFGFLWHAHICDGSEVKKTVIALTEHAAVRRANRVIRRVMGQ